MSKYEMRDSYVNFFQYLFNEYLFKFFQNLTPIGVKFVPQLALLKKVVTKIKNYLGFGWHCFCFCRLSGVSCFFLKAVTSLTVRFFVCSSIASPSFPLLASSFFSGWP